MKTRKEDKKLADKAEKLAKKHAKEDKSKKKGKPDVSKEAVSSAGSSSTLIRQSIAASPAPVVSNTLAQEIDKGLEEVKVPLARYEDPKFMEKYYTHLEKIVIGVKKLELELKLPSSDESKQTIYSALVAIKQHCNPVYNACNNFTKDLDGIQSLLDGLKEKINKLPLLSKHINAELIKAYESIVDTSKQRVVQLNDTTNKLLIYIDEIVEPSAGKATKLGK